MYYYNVRHKQQNQANKVRNSTIRDSLKSSTTKVKKASMQTAKNSMANIKLCNNERNQKIESNTVPNGYNKQRDTCQTARESTKPKDLVLSDSLATQQTTNDKGNKAPNQAEPKAQVVKKPNTANQKTTKFQTAPNSARVSDSSKPDKAIISLKNKIKGQQNEVDQHKKIEQAAKSPFSNQKSKKVHQIQIQTLVNQTASNSVKKQTCKTERDTSKEAISSKRANSHEHSLAETGNIPKPIQKSPLKQTTNKEKIRQVSHSLKPKKELQEITFPIPSVKFLQLYGHKLNNTEKVEISEYTEIYYFGNTSSSKQSKKKLNATQRIVGFDDEKGDYLVNPGEQIGYRYEVISIIDTGSFGVAVKCFDHKTKQQIALKIIRSKKSFYHQATVEVKILKYIQEHDKNDSSSIVKVFDYFIFRKHIVLFS